jgi:hypothetical protein
MDASTFRFVTPRALRNNIVESVEFAGFLWVLAQEVDDEYQDEVVRTVVLYNIAIIEALLLFWAKKHNIRFYDEKYRHPTPLAREFQKTDQILVVAYQSKTDREESRIWLHDLIVKGEQFLGKELRDEVASLQDIRNTFHLSRVRRTLSLKKAKESFDVVLQVVNKVKKEVLKKNYR